MNAGACALLDVGLCVKLCLLTDFVCVCVVGVCALMRACVFLRVSVAQCCLIGRFEYYCSWQEVFSFFFPLDWLNRLASIPSSALARIDL